MTALDPLIPRPTEPTYGSTPHYLGDKGEAYFAHYLHKETAGIIEARKFSSFIRPEHCVLDFGCGGGFVLKGIQCRRRIGVEINPAARKVATANGIECYGDLSDVPDSTADVVISNHALEHVPYPLEALKGLRRALTPVGSLIIVLPIDDWRTQLEFDPNDINHHLYTWTPQLIGNCLLDAGFSPENIKVQIITHAWFPGYHRAFLTLPESLFDLICRLYSALVRRRQIMAIARGVKEV